MPLFVTGGFFAVPAAADDCWNTDGSKNGFWFLWWCSLW